MAKKVKTILKLQIPAGQATPAPPVGPALGQHGLNIAEFCKQFNDRTKDTMGNVLPVEISVYEDNTYSFVVKTPLTSDLIKKAVGIEKGSGRPLQEKVGKISRSQIKNIAKVKIPDLNTDDIEAASRIVEGTARQMGLEIEK
ncbi:50S ribosomal protein L11 [Patescibacteria group bacterium AH-259-L07]|nr:50S ribosomal protein L11 [Patescibacteria group bacterium AH-259-L07]